MGGDARLGDGGYRLQCTGWGGRGVGKPVAGGSNPKKEDPTIAFASAGSSQNQFANCTEIIPH